MKMYKIALIIISPVLLGLGIYPTFAVWLNDPTVNLPICTANAQQYEPVIVSDGSGGAIIAWTDQRDISTNLRDIYAQRVDNSGSVLWETNGIPICQAQGDQENPAIIGDGVGGAIIAWHDARSVQHQGIYAQRIDADGNPLWTPNGTPIMWAPNIPDVDDLTFITAPAMVSDGEGGAIIACNLGRGSWGEGEWRYAILATRVSSSGELIWVKLVSPVESNTVIPAISADGSGGVVISWADASPGGDLNIYAARVSHDGTATGRIDICTAPYEQQHPAVAGDGSGGAIITWDDYRKGVDNDFDIYAQRIDAGGNVLWTLNGVEVCTAPGGQHHPNIASDIITWYDGRPGTVYHDIYAQRIAPDGSPLWTSNGVAICADNNNTHSPRIICDGSGGAIICWISEFAIGSEKNIYAQRVNSEGETLWNANGVTISSAARDQNQHNLTGDGLGGATIVWCDYRNWRDYPPSYNDDIYAQRVFSDGSLGQPIFPVVINEVYPCPIADQEDEGEWVEIYNPGPLDVNLVGWLIKDGDGELSYTIPESGPDWDGVLEAGSFLVIHISGIVDTPAEDIYIGSNAGMLSDNNDGDSISLLTSEGVGVDFIRYGSCADIPPRGTTWTGTNPEAPPRGQSLGRDSNSTDTDDGGDWENTGGVDADTPTPGRQNIEEDIIPPAAITDLYASNPTPNLITLTWTAPGDDNTTGRATEYDIRYSTSIITDDNWDAATQVEGEPTPQQAGMQQSFTVTRLLPGTTYYFAVKAVDDASNWSELSNIASGTTSPITLACLKEFAIFRREDFNGDLISIAVLIAVTLESPNSPESPVRLTVTNPSGIIILDSDDPATEIVNDGTGPDKTFVVYKNLGEITLTPQDFGIYPVIVSRNGSTASFDVPVNPSDIPSTTPAVTSPTEGMLIRPIPRISWESFQSPQDEGWEMISYTIEITTADFETIWHVEVDDSTTSICYNFDDNAQYPNLPEGEYIFFISASERREETIGGCSVIRRKGSSRRLSAKVPLYGDPSEDDSVSPYDAALILRFVVGLTELTPEQRTKADVTGNLRVTAYDGAEILRYCAQIITEFPIASAYPPPGAPMVAPVSCRISPGHVMARAGEQVVFSINVEGPKDIIAGELTLSFDRTSLSFSDISPSSLSSGYSLVHDVKEGKVRIAFASSKPISEVAEVKFKVLEETRDGSKLTLSDVRLNEVISPMYVEGGIVEVLPKCCALLQNYPNPFNPETWIPFALSKPEHVVISIYDVKGDLIRRLYLGEKEGGVYLSKSRAAYWDGRNEKGEEVASGVYFYLMEAGRFKRQRKMVLMR
jgi:predicted lipoprotein with Yx(FWY)xxD motif